MFKKLKTLSMRPTRTSFALAYVVVAALSVALSLWVQSSGNFPDPDSFYHGRVAVLISERGPLHHFPWLAKTVFADYFVDHHFLYHVILIPFVRLIPSFTDALRVSSIAFAVLAVLAGLFMLRKLGVGPVAFLAPPLFLVSNPLVFRLNLAKTPSLALVALFTGFYAAARRRLLLLGFVSFLYVWLYDGWILLLFAVSTVVLADVLVPEREGTPTDADGWHWRHRLFSRRNATLVGTTFGGIALGHVVNPYFPENLPFEWLHIVRIGIIGFKDTIGVGAEWYPYAPSELLAATSTTFFALLTGGVAFFVALMRSRRLGRPFDRSRIVDTTALSVFAAVACVFTVRSKRNVEYFVPFAVFAALSSYDLFLKVGGLEEFKRTRPLIGRAGTILVAAYLVVVMVFVAIRDLSSVRNDFTNGVPSTKYAGLATWLEKNTPEGSLIFHNDWDDPPYFWLHGVHSRFLVALDPTFMYVKDKPLFEEWVGITQSKIMDRLADRIRYDFGADYAFVDKDHPALRAAFDADKGLHLQYADPEGAIYSVR